MKSLSNRVQSLPPSGIRLIMNKAATMNGVIHLEVGDPDFPTPQGAVDVAFEAALNGATHYTPVGGVDSLRRAIAGHVSARSGVPIGHTNVVVTPGAVFAIAGAILALVDTGDEVLLPDPGWPNYVGIVMVAGGIPVPYCLDRATGFRPSVAEIERLITPRTKVLLINSPANPTGAVFEPELVRELILLAGRHDLFVLSDEIYEMLVFEGSHQSALPLDHDGRVVVVSGFSKTYAMTGWRVGYAVASPAIAAGIIAVEQPLISCASSVSQSAAEAALALGDGPVAAMRDSYRRRRDLVVSHLQPAGLLPAVPRGTFYAMVDLSRIDEDSYRLAHRLLDEQRVATTPGESFGREGRGLVRISFATAEAELVEALKRILTFASR